MMEPHTWYGDACSECGTTRVHVHTMFGPENRCPRCYEARATIQPDTVARASGNAEAAKAMGFIAGQIESSLTNREGVLAGRPLGGSDYVFGPGDYPSGGRKTTEPEGWRCECVIGGGGRADGTITKLCPAHLRSYSRWAANEKAAYVEKIKAEARAEAIEALTPDTLAAETRTRVLREFGMGKAAGTLLVVCIDGQAREMSPEKMRAHLATDHKLETVTVDRAEMVKLRRADVRACELSDECGALKSENTALLAENARLRRKLEGKR